MDTPDGYTPDVFLYSHVAAKAVLQSGKQILKGMTLWDNEHVQMK